MPEQIAAQPHSRPRQPVRAAVIGTGKIAAEHLRFLSRSPLATVDSVCDLSPAVASFAARQFGAAEAVTTLEAALSRGPDVVHVCTPAGSHAAIIRAALDAGAHVITEKPAALSYSAYAPLAELAAAKGLHLTEDHNYRFNEPFRGLAAAAASGLFGEIRDVEVTMTVPVRGGRYDDDRLVSPSHSLPAGMLHEFISHISYLGLALVGEVQSTSSLWRVRNGARSFNDLTAWADCGDATLRLRFIDAWPGRLEVRVLGTDGEGQCEIYRPRLQFDALRSTGRTLSPPENVFRNGLASMAAGVGTMRDKVLNRSPYTGLARFLEETYAGLTGDGVLPVSPRDIKRTLQLIDELLKGVDQR